MRDLKISLSEEEIQSCSKGQWKNIVKRQVKIAAFDFLQRENSEKDKTRGIVFDCLKMSDYLFHNVSTSLSKVIFSVRSGTLDIKDWNIWKHSDNICVGCNLAAETMSHFMMCDSYSKETQVNNWKVLLENDFRKQFEVARKVQERMEMREKKNIEDGLASDTLAP